MHWQVARADIIIIIIPRQRAHQPKKKSFGRKIGGEKTLGRESVFGPTQGVRVGGVAQTLRAASIALDFGDT